MKKALLLLLIPLFSCCKSSIENDSKTIVSGKIEGTWELEFITAPGKTVVDLFPSKLPTLSYDSTQKRIYGTDGCNQYNGPAIFENNSLILDKGRFISTQMACPDSSDRLFIEELFKINSYELSEDGMHLTFLTHDIATMRFGRK